MLTLFHDFTSPASAVAVARLMRLAAEGVSVTFEGIEAIGLDMALPVDLDTLAMADRLREEAAQENIVLGRVKTLPPTGLAHVLVAHAEQTPAADAVRQGLYSAFWRDGADLADLTVLRNVAVAAGMAAEPIDSLLRDRVALASQRRKMAAHRREGVGGVPVLLASRTLIPGLMPAEDLRQLAQVV